jgi:hypothetical protein
VLPFDFYDTYIIEDYYFYADGMDKDFDNWYQKLGLLSMVIYFCFKPAVLHYLKKNNISSSKLCG